MSARTKKASINSLYSLEKYITSSISHLISEHDHKQTQQLKDMMSLVIKESVSYFDEIYEMKDHDLEAAYDKIKQRCEDKNIGEDPVLVECPDFVTNADPTVVKKMLPKEQKKFHFDIEKRPAESEPSKPTDVSKPKSKHDGVSPKEKREIIRKKWIEVQEDKEAFDKLSADASNMPELPKPVAKIKGYNAILRSIFVKHETKAWINEDESRPGMNDHIRAKWKTITGNNEKYNGYVTRYLAVNAKKGNQKPPKPTKHVVFNKEQNDVLEYDVVTDVEELDDGSDSEREWF
jgi:hypothetical protein